MGENQYSKAKGWIDFFFMLNDLEAKTFQYGFLEEHKVCEKTVIDRQLREMKSRL